MIDYRGNPVPIMMPHHIKGAWQLCLVSIGYIDLNTGRSALVGPLFPQNLLRIALYI
jgi:hypothetical protein